MVKVNVVSPHSPVVLTHPQAEVNDSVEMPSLPIAVQVEKRARARALVDEYFDSIWRSLRRFGVPASSLDDAAQQVFLIATTKIDRIERGSERQFLLGTAFRVARAWWRKGAREIPSEDDAFRDRIDSRPDLEEMLDRKRERELLDKCLEEIPLDLRAVFVMFEIEGLGSDAIAEALGIPTGTVASRLRRAREKFRLALQRTNAKRAHATQVAAKGQDHD